MELDKRKFGLHSLRSGGASVAGNGGVPDKLIMKHERRASEKSGKKISTFMFVCRTNYLLLKI